jgi:hypothetical protein
MSDHTMLIRTFALPEQMEAGTAEIRSILGPQASKVTTAQIQEALWHYYYDVDKSVTYLITKFIDPPAPKVAKSAPVKNKEPGRSNFCFSTGVHTFACKSKSRGADPGLALACGNRWLNPSTVAVSSTTCTYRSTLAVRLNCIADSTYSSHDEFKIFKSTLFRCLLPRHALVEYTPRSAGDFCRTSTPSRRITRRVQCPAQDV